MVDSRARDRSQPGKNGFFDFADSAYGGAARGCQRGGSRDNYRRDRTIDLLFTDVIMPGAMNGRQLVDEAPNRRPSLKVLYTSEYTENAIVHHGRLDTGVLLLTKPYRKSELARMLRLALGS